MLYDHLKHDPVVMIYTNKCEYIRQFEYILLLISCAVHFQQAKHSYKVHFQNYVKTCFYENAWENNIKTVESYVTVWHLKNVKSFKLRLIFFF